MIMSDTQDLIRATSRVIVIPDIYYQLEPDYFEHLRSNNVVILWYGRA